MQLSRCPHGSLLCPASRFTHFTATTLSASYLNYFAPLRFHSFQPLAVHRLPVLGSPAGRCGLRLDCLICLRFALAFFSGSLVYSFHAVLPSLIPPQNTTFHFAHMPQRVIGFSNHLFAPPLLHSQAARDAWSVSATRSAIASLIAATAQPSGSRLFLLCGIFPDAHSKMKLQVTV